MKISSASKKVLASALSAAMVVAFAPTVAFGAQEGMKLKVSYDFAGGTATAAAGTQGLVTSDELTVNSDKKVTFQTVGASGNGSLQLNSGIKADGTADGYEFDSWSVYADTDKDGKIDTAKDTQVTDGDVSSAKIDSSTALYATATYKTAKIKDASVVFDQAKGQVTFTAGIDTVNGSAKGNAKFVVTAPSGTVTEKAALSGEALSAETGTWTVALVDGNGVTLDAQKFYIGNVTITGGAFKTWADAGKYATSQTVWYDAGAFSDDSSTIIDILKGADSGRVYTTAYEIDGKGEVTSTTAKGYYTASSEYIKDATIEKGEKGAVSTAVTAFFGEADTAAKIESFSYDKTVKKLRALISGDIDGKWATAAQLKDVEDNTAAGYYYVVKNAKGDIVAESADTDSKDGNNFTATARAIETAVSEAGTYTASLYKLVGKSTVLGDTTPGKMELVNSATVEVADDLAAAPTWSYTAKYKANGDVDGGTLALTNNAGDGYDVYYGTSSASSKYDATKDGVAVAAGGAADYVFQAKIKDTRATEKTVSKTITLFGYSTALSAFKTQASSFNTKMVNGKVGSYYADNADVKAAVKSAEKTFTDTGFAEKTAQASDAAAAWKSVTVAAEQSVVDVVAGVAKAELAKYAAGVASADGKTVSVLSVADYDAAVKAVEAVSAAYAVNHDGDKTNNVSKVNGVDLAASLATYVSAADEAVKAGVKKAESYKAEDVAAAKTVSDALKAAKTGAEAKAAVEAYNKLTDTQKKLVSAADVTAAQEIVSKAELAEAQDEAALAKVKGKTVKAKAKKKTTAKLTVVASKSGAKSTFKKTSGNAKITVSKAGKVTVKKGLKAGKTYTAKVKATVGAQSKTIKVTVKVSK